MHYILYSHEQRSVLDNLWSTRGAKLPSELPYRYFTTYFTTCFTTYFWSTCGAKLPLELPYRYFTTCFTTYFTTYFTTVLRTYFTTMLRIAVGSVLQCGQMGFFGALMGLSVGNQSPSLALSRFSLSSLSLSPSLSRAGGAASHTIYMYYVCIWFGIVIFGVLCVLYTCWWMGGFGACQCVWVCECECVLCMYITRYCYFWCFVCIIYMLMNGRVWCACVWESVCECVWERVCVCFHEPLCRKLT